MDEIQKQEIKLKIIEEVLAEVDKIIWRTHKEAENKSTKLNEIEFELSYSLTIAERIKQKVYIEAGLSEEEAYIKAEEAERLGELIADEARRIDAILIDLRR
jgi:hypothetical protein